MKKILYFIPTFPVISETFIEREVSKLIEFGQLDVTVLALARGKGSLSSNVEPKVVYKRLDLLTCIKAFKFIVKLPTLLGLLVELHAYKPQNFYLLIKSIGYACLIEEFKPDHVHVHFLSDPSTIVLVASKLLGVPFSVSGHAKDVFKTGTLIKEKVKASKFVTICNSFAYEKCVKLSGGISQQKIHRIYHGINSHIFEGPAKLAKPTRPVIIMGGTRLVEKKGTKYLLEAAKLLNAKGIDFQIDLVGIGDQYLQVVEQVKQLDLKEQVFIHGDGKGLPFSEVVEYYKIADIFVLPSIETSDGDADGVATVVIEAAIAKLPIITTNAGGISDLIDASNGLIVPQRDSGSIAEALERLIKDNVLRHELGEKAYSKAVTMFDIDRNVGELEHLLS